MTSGEALDTGVRQSLLSTYDMFKPQPFTHRVSSATSTLPRTGDDHRVR